jgi:hypothetical protein
MNNNNSGAGSNSSSTGGNISTTTSNSEREKILRHQAFVRTVRHFYILAYQMAFVLPIIQRTILTPDCDPSSNRDFEQIATVTFQGGEVCNDHATRTSAVLGNSYGMVFIPLVSQF